VSKWEKVRLGDCFSLSSGKFLPSSKRVVGNFNVYGGNGFVGKHNEYFTEEPTVVIGRVGEYCGCVHLTERKAWVTDNALYIKEFHRDIDGKYISFALNAKNLNSYANKSGQPSISQSAINNIVINLPPLETQKLIAKTLANPAELLAMRKQQLTELDNLIKSTFYEMFGDPVANKKGWEKRKIGDIAKVETGSTPSRNNINYYVGGLVPWVKTGEVSSGYIFSAEEKITVKAITETNCKILPEHTILVAMYGQGKTRGQVGILKIEAATNQACAAILPNNQYISEFLFRLLQIEYNELRGLGRGGNQPNLNLAIVRNFEIIRPPIKLQNQFADIVAKIEKQKALVKKAIDETQYLFDSLMSEYFD
jgi:type I restriction enzyme S subunit